VWKSIPRVDYNYFIEDQAMGDGPYHFRVTDVLGQTLEDQGIGFVEGGVVDGKGQFTPCSPK
jgi:expansin (peptidoglycan-binding protein)